MKNLVLTIISMAIIAAFCSNVQGLPTSTYLSGSDSIHIWCSPDLKDITGIWVEAYLKQNPEAKIAIITAQSADFTRLANQKSTIGIVSKEPHSSLSNASNWSMVVGRDVIVPVMNAENPYRDEIFKSGITAKSIANVINSDFSSWGMLLENDESAKTTCYLTDNESVKTYLGKFIGKEDLFDCKTVVISKNEMLKTIEANKYAIGFCKLSDIIDHQSQQILTGLSVIPIDVNENGQLDKVENIYANLNDLTRGIWIGKYPNELYSRIYAVAVNQPKNDGELAFLNWLVVDGQKTLASNGYTELVKNEVDSKIKSLYAPEIVASGLQTEAKQGNIILIILVIGILLVVISFFVLKYFSSKGQEIATDFNFNPAIFSANTAEVPGGLFFDKTHTWVFMEKEGAVRVGIDDFLQHITGLVTRVKMKNVGDSIKKGEVLLSIIQHGKKLDIYSPISGIVKENNTNLIDRASLINTSPYENGWIYVIDSVNWVKEIKAFAMAEIYSEWLKKEYVRLKDFLAATLNIKNVSQLQLVMQEGGELSDNPLEGCGPEVWEEFQTRFIDVSKESSF